MLNNDLMITLGQFKEAFDEGINEFMILDATYNQINTKNGIKDILELDLELCHNSNRDQKSVLKGYRLFLDYNTGSAFHRFVSSYVESHHKQGMLLKDLISLKGQVNLSFRQPEGSDIKYKNLNDWVFYANDGRAKKMMALTSYTDIEEQLDHELGGE